MADKKPDEKTPERTRPPEYPAPPMSDEAEAEQPSRAPKKES